MPGADDFVTEGYTACSSCGHWFVADPKRPNRRKCEGCVTADKVTAEATAVARAAARPAPKRPSRGRRRRKPTAKQAAQKRLWNRARSNALTRLRQIHPEMYEVLLAEEKAKLGLDPGLDVRPANVGPLERELTGTA